MAKYIIDVPDDTTYINAIKAIDRDVVRARTIALCELTPYTEPDREAIEDEVWKFAQKFTHESKAELNAHERMEIWGTASCDKIINDFTYSEAKAKYNAWKKQKDEIRVGDEVKHRGLNYVVGYVGADKVYHLIDKNWLRTVVQGGYQLIKTGRHFPEVAELLKKMRGEQDE